MKRTIVCILFLGLGFGAGIAGTNYYLDNRAPVAQTAAQWAFIADSPAALARQADLVVVARHVTAAPGRQVGSTPFTLNGFAVETVGKGLQSSFELLVEQTGGLTSGDVVLSINDGGAFVPGARYLLFLKHQGGGVFYQINHQARYEIDGDGLIGVDASDSVVAAFEAMGLDRALALIETNS